MTVIWPKIPATCPRCSSIIERAGVSLFPLKDGKVEILCNHCFALSVVEFQFNTIGRMLMEKIKQDAPIITGGTIPPCQQN